MLACSHQPPISSFLFGSHIILRVMFANSVSLCSPVMA
jgi:hypothetical protein